MTGKEEMAFTHLIIIFEEHKKGREEADGEEGKRGRENQEPTSSLTAAPYICN